MSTLLQTALVAALIMLSSYVLVPLAGRRLNILGVWDEPTSNSTHSSRTVRGVGIGFGAAALAGLAVYGWLHVDVPGSTFSGAGVLGCCAVLIAVLMLGAMDDLYGLGVLVRLTAELLLGAGMGLVLALTSGVGLVVGAVVGALSLAVACNAWNLYDGMDGLSGTTAIAALAGMAVMACLLKSSTVMFLAVSVLASVVGFLPWNRHPAKYFMGDAGSLFLGAALVTCALALSFHTPSPRVVLAALCVFGLPLVDMAATVARRVISKRSPFAGDHEHLYNLLAERLRSVSRTVLVLGASQGVLSAVGVLVLVVDSTAVPYLLAVYVLIAGCVVVVAWTTRSPRPVEDAL